MGKYLYGASVQGIQEYIFTTNELKSIVGASNIVKNINEYFKKHYEKYIIVNAAGNVKLIFDSKDEFEDMVKNFIKETRQEAYGLKISQAVVAFEKGELKEAFQELEKKLAVQKNRVDLPLDISINILKNAKKTAKPAVESDKDKATLQKEDANPDRANMPKNSKNKTAVIHADGNGLGAKIAAMTDSLKTDKEVIKAYKNFSMQLETATLNAFESAKQDIKNIREIILGGDDITVVCDANDALDFTEKFLSAFEKETQRLFQNEGLTACAGIAFANHKYPFHYAVNLAESLCNYAKTHSKEIMQHKKLSLAPSSLMFHNIQSSNFERFEDYVENELTLKNDSQTIHLNYGPYFVNKQDNYATITAFRHLCGALMLSGSPMSRYREWLTILSQNATQAKERMKRINSMLDLKNDVYRKDIFVKCLKQFSEDIKVDEMIVSRGAEKYTPIHDIDTYLSVIDDKRDNEETCDAI